MLGKIYKELITIILLFLVCWYAFILLKPSTDIDFSVSSEMEESLGDKMALQIIGDLGGESDDSARTLIIDTIQNRLLASLETTRFNYEFHLVNSTQINAFAGMGGHIFITTGIVDFCETPEQLAAIIAHEMGHVEHRHVLTKLSRDLGVAVLILISSGGDPSILAEVISHTVSTSFSRNHEEEADDFGLKLLEKSRLKPVHMATVFIKLKTHTKDQSIEIPAFFSTHPDLSDRINNAAKYKTKDDFSEVPFELE